MLLCRTAKSAKLRGQNPNWIETYYEDANVFDEPTDDDVGKEVMKIQPDLYEAFSNYNDQEYDKIEPAFHNVFFRLPGDNYVKGDDWCKENVFVHDPWGFLKFLFWEKLKLLDDYSKDVCSDENEWGLGFCVEPKPKQEKKPKKEKKPEKVAMKKGQALNGQQPPIEKEEL